MVLVVDGDPACAEALGDALRAEGHQVEIACDEAGAIACLSSTRPDVVLIDTYLGAVDGLELVSRLRRSELASTPILLTTALPLAEVRRGEAADMVAAILAKPFQLETVLELVRACHDERGSISPKG
ncbi:MAG TPA: response regulator [Vulgatibacter sp.]|nr:response regulator [Vulgatibacter sp.]